MIIVVDCSYCGGSHLAGDPCEKFADRLLEAGYGTEMVRVIDGLRHTGWSSYDAFLSYLDAAVQLEILGMTLSEIEEFLRSLSGI